MHIRIRRGRRLRVPGAPAQEVTTAPPARSAAVLGADYRGVRFAIQVETGQRVDRGAPLLVDRRNPRIVFTAPVAGTIREIARGPRRSLSALVIDHDGDTTQTFDTVGVEDDPQALRNLLLAAGEWPAFVRRPFGTIPDPDERPDAIFVNAIDTNPLAADPAELLSARRNDFRAGLAALVRLSDGPVFVCHGGGIDETALPEGVRGVRFSGPHPAGLPGTHIHHLRPVDARHAVWQIGGQDVAAIGRLIATGQPDTERVVALAGPGVTRPRLIRTVVGADIDDLLDDELTPGNHRVISGSVLAGRISRFLGRHHRAITVLPEAAGSSPFGWAEPPRDTAQHGKRGRFVPVAAFDSVLPLNIMVAPLLRALIVGDEEAAERLGCLELLEEDVALLSYVCPAKIDYAPLLRNVLDKLAEAA